MLPLSAGDLRQGIDLAEMIVSDNFFSFLIVPCGLLVPVVENNLIGRSCRN